VGFLSAIHSLIPLVSICCCIWSIIGGVLASFLYVKGSSVPVKLGAKGVEQIIQLELTAEEKAALNKSADAVREILTVMGG
jgi:hypothetical protein